jgi:NADH-quinone oxidoreductase subunit M
MISNQIIAGDEGIGIVGLMFAIPLFGAVSMYLLPFLFGERRDPEGSRSRNFAFAISIIPLILALVQYLVSESLGFPGVIESAKRLPWIPQVGASFLMGIDGISLPLILLTGFLVPLAIATSRVTHHHRGFFAHLLLAEGAIIGALCALDLLLFYIFWELMVIPLYFLIGIWGGKRRIFATLKFITYTVSASLLMLLAILYLVWSSYRTTGVLTFAFDGLVALHTLSQAEQSWLFAAFAIACAVKIPLFPFHTWMVDAYTESPTAALIVSSGVMIKLGLYVLIRFAYPLFPLGASEIAPFLGVLAVFGIVYGALIAWQQNDIRRLLAFSSLSHVGFCVLGIVALETISVTGALFQAVAHGLTVSGLFIVLGWLSEQRKTREIGEFGGLASHLPRCALVLFLLVLSSIALPLTASFNGEFLILMGAFKAFPLATILASSGVVLGALYMLSLYQKIMLGEFDRDRNGALKDLSFDQCLLLLPLLVLVFQLGFAPSILSKPIEHSVKLQMPKRADLKDSKEPVNHRRVPGAFQVRQQERSQRQNRVLLS